MKPKDPYAMYIYCDGAMDYGSNNPGGIGYSITFPESIPLAPISVSLGTYIGGNIEQLELEALIKAMKAVLEIFNQQSDKLKIINRIIFITDRFGLREDGKTSAYQITDWRRNGWKNHENKPIKNHKLLDELDKVRSKLSREARARVHIEYKPRKQNKVADKLAKTGKKNGLPIDKLKKRGEKIGKRKFDGAEITYQSLKANTEYHINVFRKDPVQQEWEVWVEICTGELKGRKLKIYADDGLSRKLKRGNEVIIKIKSVFKHHIHIFRTIRRI
jgi:ribonuclease HI